MYEEQVAMGLFGLFNTAWEKWAYTILGPCIRKCFILGLGIVWCQAQFRLGP